jgi:hypothetical protein
MVFFPILGNIHIQMGVVVIHEECEMRNIYIQTVSIGGCSNNEDYARIKELRSFF